MVVIGLIIGIAYGEAIIHGIINVKSPLYIFRSVIITKLPTKISKVLRRGTFRKSDGPMGTIESQLDTHVACPAAYAGFVSFKVVSVTSGMAPLSVLGQNYTVGNGTVLPLDHCIFPGSGPHTPIYAGSLVH